MEQEVQRRRVLKCHEVGVYRHQPHDWENGFLSVRCPGWEGAEAGALPMAELVVARGSVWWLTAGLLLGGFLTTVGVAVGRWLG